MGIFCRTKRRRNSLLGIIAVFAAGTTAFTWFTSPIGATQAGGPQEAVRMPDRTAFPTWERPV